MRDLRLLQNFVAVFHSRSFRAAADELERQPKLGDQTYSTIGKRAWTKAI